MYAIVCCVSLKSIEIPNSVTTIDKEAFFDCSAITSVRIPAGVSKIKGGIIGSCDNLVYIDVDSEIYYFCSVSGVLYSKDKRTLVSYSAGRPEAYVIPNGVCKVEASTFYVDKNITSVALPLTLVGIGEKAFMDCEKSDSVSISKNVSTIGINAFKCCKEFETVFWLAGLIVM